MSTKNKPSGFPIKNYRAVVERLSLEASQEPDILAEREDAEWHIHQLVSTIRRVQFSRTWRATKPVRFIIFVLRRIPRKIRGLGKPKPITQPEWDPLQHPQRAIHAWRNFARHHERYVHQLRGKLVNLGFEARAYDDLVQVASSASLSYAREAAWELAVWHANRYRKRDSRFSLAYLEIAHLGHVSPERERGISIMEAEGLLATGEAEAARRLLDEQLLAEPDCSDLCLARANAEPNPEAKMEWINQALRNSNIASVDYEIPDKLSPYDGLGKTAEDTPAVTKSPLISVIIPIYNAEDTVATALDATLNQTWQNLEILAVDDCSTDRTADVIRSYEQKHDNITLLQTPQNSGPYVARNIALQHAQGEFITTTDSDDWSHPEKLERQALHLLDSPGVAANMSQSVRALEDLTFYRRGRGGGYIQFNMSSLMFRREVLDTLGYWDSVRFAADAEFIHRIKAIYGREAVVNMEPALYSIMRQSSDTLTSSSAFGYHGFFMGARKEYREAHEHYHANTDGLCYDFPMDKRPFPVPAAMLPERPDRPRHFDVVLASDFTDIGGSNASNIEEIKAQRQAGLKTGLMQMYRYDARSERIINPKLREQVDGEYVQRLVYGERATCDVLILRYPPVLQEWQHYIPDVTPKHIHVIINQTPLENYGENGMTRWEIGRAQKQLEEYFGKAAQDAIWHPIGPMARQALVEHHQDELHHINLSDTDWTNIINIDEWRREKRPKHKRPVIGRHARDSQQKWPAKADDILNVYPDDKDIEVRILGGAELPRSILGYVPENWTVYPYNSLPVRNFLADLDVFVYHPNPNLLEAFGRNIFEAMAVGVPVILHPRFESVFGEAALYAEAENTQSTILELLSSESLYNHQAEKGVQYVKQNHGYDVHAHRI